MQCSAQFSSNALTRWIGYQWPQQKDNNLTLIKLNGINYNETQIKQSMFVSINKINNNDIHFYNAIRLLLQINYVFSFSSFYHDFTSINATKHDKLLFDQLKKARIHEVKPLDVLANKINYLYNITDDQLLLRLPIKTKIPNFSRHHLRPQTVVIAQLLTEKDYKALYWNNYFDFRLYLLGKQVDTLDRQFYEMQFEKYAT